MRKKIEIAVKAYHSHLSPEWISEQSIDTLLAYCHPDDRFDFKLELKNEE